MKDSGSGSDCELIIDPVLLAQIQAHCGKIAAELEAQSAHRLSAEEEAQRFATSVSKMPANVRAFFEHDESPYVRPHRRESDQAREEREERTSFGGWCG
jgi:hypothetical protein